MRKAIQPYEVEGQMSFLDFPEVMPEIPREPEQNEIRVSEQESAMNNYEFREEICNALARMLIQSCKAWFAQDIQNRVVNVIESEKQIKEKIKDSSRTWYFNGDSGEIFHANLFDEYVQFWGKDHLGNCEWFYLCAAIQGMWNVIALEDIQKENISSESRTEDPEQKEAEAEELEEPAVEEPESEEAENALIEYDRATLAKMIDSVRETLELMREYWLASQPLTYTKYSMQKQAYEMLLRAHDAEEEKDV